ncbi:DNA polymerase alpha, subunit B [Amylocystis lapponica]|nr:DNA polymerase alpha, subunit B [Amylocystis lapponica]
MASENSKQRSSAMIREQLLEKFGESLEDSLLTECVTVCQMFNIGGDDFFWKWESIVFATVGQKVFNADSVKAVKALIQSGLVKQQAKRQQGKVQLGGVLSKNLFGGLKVPNGRFGIDVVKRAPAVPRQDGFGVTSGEVKMPVAGPSRVAFVGPHQSRSSRAYRYMYEKVSERSEALDDRIDDFGELVKEHYAVDDLGDPSASTEEEVTVVGRITSDQESFAGSGKLNEASLALESSRMMASGARVPLRFEPGVKVRQGKQGAEGVGLFPGAIVALKGKNGGGGWFSVTEILSLPPLKAPSSGNGRSDGDSFSMYIACGPYTPDADLKYKPWHGLLSKMKSDKPAVILLTGPFVDCTHSCIKNGDVNQSPADLFREQFLTPLRDFLASAPDSLVLIVPSVRDMISDHAVFPQCELSQEFSADPRIHLLPNPARFSLNGISFGVSSLDVLFHLRKEEFVRRAQEVDPRPTDGDAAQVDTMANTCRHLLQQRSFYPLFPVPLDLAHEVNLDVSHARGADLCGEGVGADVAPAVLVIPSRLKHFSKVVDSTVAVNPSFLTKGTYATLRCSGAGEEIPLRERFKVDVVRLNS